tara:strand:- start:43 stop:738 length:696 start_codon:yes stop_codon:yes gene_type:complete
MAIIDNHKSVKIDKTFEDKHPEMFKFFNDKNIDVEVSDDFKGLKTFLTSLPKEDYPYNFDNFFDPDTINVDNAFVLYLKKDNNIISTYTARVKEFKYFYDDFAIAKKFEKSEELITLTQPLSSKGRHMYSSCQWVSKEHRGNGFGMILDHLKKNICFDIFNASSNYALHKESLKDYHLNGLHYNVSIHLATIPQGDVGGAGDKKDKIYNVCWIEKDAWLNKLNDVRKLYNR